MLRIDDIILSDADKKRFADAEPVERATPDRRFNLDKCGCGQSKRVTKDLCVVCTKERRAADARYRAKERYYADKELAKKHPCNICNHRTYTIFEYAGLDLCYRCCNDFVKLVREKAMRKENKRIIDERHGTGTKINDNQAGSEIRDVHERRKAC